MKIKQNFKNVQDHSIGMGLACSHDIARALGGDTMIKQSNNGLTIFLFRIPVHVEESAFELINTSSEEQSLTSPKFNFKL